jgi:hypothetical protein
MPRTVFSKVRLELPAREAWRLRCDFVLEQHIASLNRRKLALVEEDVHRRGATDEQRQRLVRCDLQGDHLNGGVMGVKTSDLGSEILSTFYVNLFDEAHGAEFAVDVALSRLSVSITGHQWCLPESDLSCFLCTRTQLEAKIVGIGGLVEMQLERQIRASNAAFPDHAYAYRAKECVVVPRAPVARRPGEAVAVLPTLPEGKKGQREEDEDEDEEGGGEEAEASAGPAGAAAMATATGLKVQQWRLVGTSLLKWMMHRPRRHRSLCDTKPVRVHRRHARLLLLCGCADAVVDSDEIIE